jgi:uncharacterized YccA/Bax inhibitor family protein
MAVYRTGNPALGEDTFRGATRAGGASMTLQGAVNKTGISLLIMMATATVTWNTENVGLASLLLLLGLVGGLVVAMVTIFKKEWSPFTTPLYAALEGLVLGAISQMYEQKFEGIVPLAVGLTMGTLGALLLAYTSRLIKVTENFRLGVFAATGAIALFYLVGFVLRLFGIPIPLVHESGIVGVGFSAVVVTIAALNLVLDFDFIERGAASGAPKYMEWYAAFGLLVTLVWLYLEILRLLSKLQGKDRR